MSETEAAAEDRGCSKCRRPVRLADAVEDADGWLICPDCIAHIESCTDSSCHH
jgi:hypothetical protein